MFLHLQKKGNWFWELHKAWLPVDFHLHTPQRRGSPGSSESNHSSARAGVYAAKLEEEGRAATTLQTQGMSGPIATKGLHQWELDPMEHAASPM